MNKNTRTEYIAQNTMNQMHYQHIQDLVFDKDDEFAAYISSFEDVKLTMGDQPFVQADLQQFWDSIKKYNMHHCTIFHGRWLIVINLHYDLASSLFPKCV